MLLSLEILESFFLVVKKEKDQFAKDYLFLPLRKKMLAVTLLRKTLWPLFMDGVQLSQSYRATTRRQFTRSSWYSFNQLQGWKAELTSEPPSIFKPGTPGFGIQCLNHWEINKLNSCTAIHDTDIPVKILEDVDFFCTIFAYSLMKHLDNLISHLLWNVPI